MYNLSRFRLPRKPYRELPVSLYCTFVSDNITVPFATKYDSKKVESNKYDEWNSAGYFKCQPNGDTNTFSVILPPPNITGTLHLGHALTVTIQDILCRWKRMQGLAVVWVPGTDHAGIATQVIVEKKLFSETGQTRYDVGREKFLQMVDEWKTEKMNRINDQLKQLGASVDWSRYYFTMDSKQSDAVREAVIRMFEDGLLYREKSMVNWCCYLQSTISDYEIEYIQLDKPTKLLIPGYDEPIEFGKISHVGYRVIDSEEEIVVTTTRPETIFGDVAVAVHPSDNRYKHLHGARVRNPLTQTDMPIICDEAVNINFGTGAVKITPGHSRVDLEIGKRHNLPMFTILTQSGHLNDVCGELAGLPRFVARQKVETILSDVDSLKDVRDHEMQLPLCSRSGDVIEQFIKSQWFVKCNELKAKAVQAIENGDLVIEPHKHRDMCLRWLATDEDWCVSRQLWWGHQLPLYKTDCGWVAAKSEAEAKAKAHTKLGYESKIMERDKDVLDTWFSSALLPFSVFGWPEKNDDMKRFYPLSFMETGADILNFWVVRMVLLGLYFTESIPFKEVFLHGMICDSRGRKMSKSLGNVIDFEYLIHGITLKELKDQLKANHDSGLLAVTELQYALKFQKELFPRGIASCGADALRLTLASLQFKDQSINFNPNQCRDNTAFCNKMWQASKFIIGWALNLRINTPVVLEPQNLWQHWLLDSLARTVLAVDDGLTRVDFHVAVKALKKFFHHDLCDTYLEIAKPILRTGDTEEARVTCAVMLHCLEVFLRLIFPIIPFVSDELYSHLPTQGSNVIWKTEFPRTTDHLEWVNENALTEMNLVKEIVTSARYLIQSLQFNRKEADVAVVSEDNPFLEEYCSIMLTLTRCNSFVFCSSNSDRIYGPVSTVENKALVHLILPEVDNGQLLANMNLLRVQMTRPQKELNMRLENSRKAKNPNRKFKEILAKWNHFQSSADEFFKNSVESGSLQTMDLMTASKFVFEAYEFRKQIIDALKTE